MLYALLEKSKGEQLDQFQDWYILAMKNDQNKLVQ